MRIFQKLLDFYLDASIHVALAVLSLFWATVYFLNLPPNFYLAGLVFFGSMVFYNLAKDTVGLHTLRRGSKRYYRSIRFLSMASLLAVAFFFFQLSPVLQWSTLVIAILSALYLVPIPGLGRGMRSLGWLKIVWVGLSWTAVTVYLPVAGTGLPIGNDGMVLGVQRVIMVVCLMLPFEIRDACRDAADMRTLPQRFGIPSTRWLGYFLLLLYFLLVFARSRFTVFELFFHLLFAGLMYAALRRSRADQGRYYAAFWVESIPIVLWLGLLWLKNGSRL